MSQQSRSTFVLFEPNEILEALVGLKDIRVLHYKRSGPQVELMIEQLVGTIRCPACDGRVQVKERPGVHYIDVPVYGAPIRLAWKKHRMCCLDARCHQQSFVLQHHSIAKNCPLTTRAKAMDERRAIKVFLRP